MQKLFCTLGLLVVASCNGAYCDVNIYSANGKEEGKILQNVDGFAQYDKSGQKITTFKKTSNGYELFDKDYKPIGRYQKVGVLYYEFNNKGERIGYFITDDKGTLQAKYDVLGRKISSYKKTKSGEIVKYNRYGMKVLSYKK